MNERALTSAIVGIVGSANVDSNEEALAGLGISATSARAWLVRPGSAAEVAELIGLAGRHEVAVVPVGNAARSPRAAALNERMRLVLDTRRMNHVLHLDETSLVAHVQAGLTGLAFEKILAPRRLSLGDYPPAVLRSTMGGLLSVRTPGKLSTRHGFFEDAVLGVSAVLADGRLLHTRVAPRRSTGPDLARALCGSEGTLGFITSVVLRIHRRPEARFLAAYAMPDFAAALSAVHLAFREEASPAALRAYDSAEAKAHFGALLSEPDAAVRDEAVLVAATAGPTDLAACDRDLIASAAAALGGRELPHPIAESWSHQRSGHMEGELPPMPALQVTAAPSKQKAVYRAVCGAVEGAGFAARAYASRFGPDGAVMFFTFCSNGSHELLRGDEQKHARHVAEEAARSAGAYLLDSANAGARPYLAELRRNLDPKGIMNPGALIE